MVAFDNTILSLLIFPDAELRQGSGGQKVECARERVLGLVQVLEDAREQVVVPAPALSELLVTDGADVQDILTTLHGSSFIRIESFDEARPWNSRCASAKLGKEAISGRAFRSQRAQ
jgi:hypothetical protein